MNVDTLILTRGQWLVDAIVWAGIKKPKRGQRTLKYTVDSLQRYMGRMDGRTELIGKLQQAQARSTANPRNRGHLGAFGKARQTLEAHIKTIEIAHDMRHLMRGGTLCESRREQDRKKRKPRITRGWTVSEASSTKAGKIRYRLSTTSMADGKPRQVGTYESRAEAEQEGRRMIAELRGTDPHPN